MAPLNNSLNIFTIVLLNSVLSKLFSQETNVMGMGFFVGGAYRLGFSYCLHAVMGTWASIVRIFVVYFNAFF